VRCVSEYAIDVTPPPAPAHSVDGG